MSNQLLRGRGSEAKRRGRGKRWVLHALLRLEVVPARIGLLLLFGLPRRRPVAPSLPPSTVHRLRRSQSLDFRSFLVSVFLLFKPKFQFKPFQSFLLMKIVFFMSKFKVIFCTPKGLEICLPSPSTKCLAGNGGKLTYSPAVDCNWLCLAGV